jgi:hypothetical protein
MRSPWSYVRSGGVVAFKEVDYLAGFVSLPRVELVERYATWNREVMTRAGSELSPGLKLFQTYLDAGLPEPEMRAVSLVSSTSMVDGMAANLRRHIPRILEYGIASVEEVDIDTYAERLRDEVENKRAVCMGWPLVDAWARKP